MKSKFTLIILGIFIIAQGQIIKTAQLFNPQTNDLTPFINIGEYLIFSFDDLDADYKRYPYKIVRYDRNWILSQIYTSEFLTGYAKNYFRDYKPSFNTRLAYSHYELNIPNKDFNFKLSGNYGVQLLDPKNKTVLFEKRFSVYEDLTQIGVHIDRVNNPGPLNQQVTVQVVSTGINLLQNSDNAELVLLKNNNWHDAIKIKSPTFVLANKFSYNNMNQVFSGGVEYNWFDTKSLDVSGMTTEQSIANDIYTTVLYPDIFYPDQAYMDRPDVNGNYFIRSIQIPSQLRAGYEADYTNVYFALDGYKPGTDEELFVYGAFNDFKPTEESMLKYDPVSELYETNILLKQGYYNYSYGIVNKITGAVDYNKITGSYWETENLYNAMFYIRPWGKRYDLLVGYGEGYSRPSQK